MLEPSGSVRRRTSPAPRSAVVHDFFVTEGGGEAVALEFARLLPQAPVHTSFFDAARFGDRLDPARVRTWPLQRLLGPTRHFRALYPLYPLYFGALDLRRARLVISSSVAFTKAVRTAPSSLHLSYVYTPLRYAWQLESYLQGSSLPRPAKAAARAIRPLLQRWDRGTAGRPDVIVTSSETVRRRIQRLWDRDAEVIHPPVETAGIALSTRDDGYLLIASRLLAYRRVDLAVAAATRLGRRLVVVGDGPERARLERIAGPTVRFAGHIDRAALLELFAGCHAYLVPGVEDFGMAPVEAMAAGKPVVARRAGGATETVVDGATGIFFDEPTAAALADAIERLDRTALSPDVARARALTFDGDVFRRRWRELLAREGADPSLYSGGWIEPR
ncbi:MAG: glycosyltransferase [Chloroflexi bacterium]|nr:glycosyltransferase [Chloroflexota bacterium]